ncbi:unnamed protein product [Closterium sp. Yama58-4]|nr:unnamed protein product [Closterium sp. Yama58-4]
MGPGIWRCKAAEVGKPGAAKAVAAVCEEHAKAGSSDFTALMRKVNMALRKYSTEERKRDSKGILEAASEFYAKLFSEPTPSTDSSHLPIAPDKRLGEAQAQLLVAEWSEVEVKEALDGMAKGKSPGADGIPKEFFGHHWDLLGGDLLGFVKQFEESATLPPAALEAVTVLLHKKGAKDRVQNYRPITLLNSTYKLVARVLANSMRKVLHKVISEEQYGFLPGRRLADGVSLIADIVEAAKCKDEDWYLLLVDFQKAFDSVSRNYLFGTMERMGFPRKFVQWCEGLHAGSTTRLLLNGWLGEPVAVRKGVRQGCPLAPYLFLCAVEPLCQEALKRKLGISNPYGDRLAYLRYADDTTLVLKGKRQIGRTVKLLSEFGEKSGLRVNNDKSALLPLGKNLRKKPDKSSVFKWVRSNEAERVLGVWISPSGDASVTWEITLPPPSEIWAKLVKLLHNFVTGNHSTAGKHFALWSQELLFKARGDGGLGVRDLCAELGGLAARRIALLASQPLGLLADLALAALDVPDLQVFWAHAGLIKQWEGRCERWKRTCELFLESSFPSCINVSSVWDVEQEMLLFNRQLLLNGKTPAGRQKAAKSMKRSVMGDLIKVAADGSRALKDTQELERDFGGPEGVKLVKRLLDAAPDEWKQLLLTPVTARTVLTVSKFVLKTGTSYGVWRIESVEGETLVCRAVKCFRGVMGEAEERLCNFLPHEVVPAVPVVRALLKALRMLNPHRKIESLGDMIFKKEGTASGFPEATITAISFHRIWVERCDAVFERSKFRARRALRRIAASFQLHENNISLTLFTCAANKILVHEDIRSSTGTPTGGEIPPATGKNTTALPRHPRHGGNGTVAAGNRTKGGHPNKGHHRGNGTAAGGPSPKPTNGNAKNGNAPSGQKNGGAQPNKNGGGDGGAQTNKNGGGGGGAQTNKNGGGGGANKPRRPKQIAEETCSSKTSWPEVVGMTGEKARDYILTSMPECNWDVRIIPNRGFATMDYRTNRVRIFLDKEGIVRVPPRIG